MAQVAVLNRVRGVRVSVHRPAGRAVLAALGCLLVGGCLFAPRVAEPPQTGDIVVYLDQIEPWAAWDNLQTSAGATHAPGWEGAISPTGFIYKPDDAAENPNPGVFAGWDRDREIAFINALFNSGVEIVALMRNPEFRVPPTSGSKSVWESVIYDLKVTTNGVDGSTLRYRGSARITFSLEGNFWYITEWEDLVGENDPETNKPLSTMGVLRANFSSK
jgi:hypothetical protein